MDARGEEKISEDFAKGFFAMHEGDNPYEHRSTPYTFGRFVGSATPAWDDGRQAGAAFYGIGTKFYHGENVELSDWAKAGEHTLKTGKDIVSTYGGLKGVSKARSYFLNTVKKYTFKGG